MRVKEKLIEYSMGIAYNSGNERKTAHSSKLIAEGKCRTANEFAFPMSLQLTAIS
jgi:hypothetical protein